MHQKTTFQSQDGVTLSGIWHLPENATGRTVILAHGITSNKEEGGIFVELAERLKEHGIAALRFDFRGHGESEGLPEEMTIAGELGDLEAAVREAAKRGCPKVGVLGASFGGGISIFYAASHPEKIAALCLWNPCLNYDNCFLHPTLPWLKDHHERMSRDLDFQGWTFLGDSSFKVGRNLFNEMAVMKPFESMPKIAAPALLIHGDRDAHIPYEDARQYAGTFAGPAEFLTIPDGVHGFQSAQAHVLQANGASLAFFEKYLPAPRIS